MKQVILYSITILIILSTGCHHSTNSPEPDQSDISVIIEAESDFLNDPVMIVLDQDTLLESGITTNNILDLAWSSGMKTISRDEHLLQVIMADQAIQKNYLIDTTDDISTVLIRFNRDTKQLSIGQSKGIILRD